MRNAKEISHVVGVTLALSLLSLSAEAGVGADILRTSDTPEFMIGSGMSAGTISRRNRDVIWPPDGPVGRQDLQTGAVDTMQLGATGFTLAPVGSSGDVRWALFNRGEWDVSEETTEIPEPAPLAILGLAILTLGFYRRHRHS
jgi:hypothetical protein